MVIWFIGLSGAGKSTMGRQLIRFFTERDEPAFLIDGDEARAFFDGDLGFTREDRAANIKRIIYAAHVLHLNGITAIVCNISPFEELRSFARRKIGDYHEIYLRRQLPALVASDPKGVYQHGRNGTPVVGLQIPFDEPLQSDLVLDLDGLSIQDAASRVTSYLHTRHPTRFA